MSTPDRPNIILITTDQQRYDTLGVTGNAQIRTPNLESHTNQKRRWFRNCKD